MKTIQELRTRMEKLSQIAEICENDYWLSDSQILDLVKEELFVCERQLKSEEQFTMTQTRNSA